MNPIEYDRMAAAEDGHWWYRGLRDVIERTLRTRRFALPEAPHVLDAGCGTGANLRLMRDRFAPAWLGGFDASPRALEYARRKVPEAEIHEDDIRDPRIPTVPLDLIICCDVIYVPGAEESLPGLRRLVSRLRTGGMFLLHLPAYDWLYSRHDVAIHTRERYTAGRVKRLLHDLDLRPELLSYRLCGLFPAIVAARLPSILSRKPNREEARSDVAIPSRIINESLTRILGLENRLVANGVRLPWGSSVYAIGRKTRD